MNQPAPELIKEIGKSNYQKFLDFNIQPTEEHLAALLYLASSRGKSIGELVYGIIDAVVGEFERLKEFGIKVSKESNEVTFYLHNQTVKSALVDFFTIVIHATNSKRPTEPTR